MKPGKPLDVQAIGSKYITNAADYGGGKKGGSFNMAEGGYNRAMDRALLFLKAQKSGIMKEEDGISWRSTAGMG